jgi:type II secretory pathway component PulF
VSKRLTLQEHQVLATLLARSIENGQTLHAALETLGREAPTPRLRQVFATTSERLAAGRSVREALEPVADLLDPALRQILARSGPAEPMAQALRRFSRLAALTEKRKLDERYAFGSGTGALLLMVLIGAWLLSITGRLEEVRLSESFSYSGLVFLVVAVAIAGAFVLRLGAWLAVAEGCWSRWFSRVSSDVWRRRMFFACELGFGLANGLPLLRVLGYMRQESPDRVTRHWARQAEEAVLSGAEPRAALLSLPPLALWRPLLSAAASEEEMGEMLLSLGNELLPRDVVFRRVTAVVVLMFLAAVLLILLGDEGVVQLYR